MSVKIPNAVIINRVLFFVIPIFVSCLRWHYLGFLLNSHPGDPNSGGEDAAGGILIFFDAILSTLVLLPLSFVFWSRGCSNVRFRKTLLAFVMFIVDLPLVFIVIFIISLQIRFFSVGHY